MRRVHITYICVRIWYDIVYIVFNYVTKSMISYSFALDLW